MRSEAGNWCQQSREDFFMWRGCWRLLVSLVSFAIRHRREAASDARDTPHQWAAAQQSGYMHWEKQQCQLSWL